MYHYTSNIIHSNFPLKSFNFHKPETKKGKMRLVNFFAIPFQNVFIGGFCRSQILSVKITCFVQHFGKFDSYRVAFVSFYLQSNPTNHILSHIQHCFTFGRGHYFYGLNFLYCFNCNSLRSNQYAFWMF